MTEEVKKEILTVGGIVHSDGNIFFSNQAQLASYVKLKIDALEQAGWYGIGEWGYQHFSSEEPSYMEIQDYNMRKVIYRPEDAK